MTGRKGEDAFDGWSLVHFASGLALGLLPIGWLLAVVLVVGYEGLEGILRRFKTVEGGLFEYESWANVAMDIILGIAGYAITHIAIEPFLPWSGVGLPFWEWSGVGPPSLAWPWRL